MHVVGRRHLPLRLSVRLLVGLVLLVSTSVVSAPSVSAPSVSAPSVSGPTEPLAVAPWRNLAADPGLAWLEQGVAETMAADLRRGGFAVVERAQVTAALREVQARVGVGADDTAQAVAAGKLIGARSVVIGSFQAAGAELRLVARIVDVETGTVGPTAKATGPRSRIFALQDDVVRGLLPKTSRPTARTGRSGRSGGSGRSGHSGRAAADADVEAYATLGRALAASTPEAQRAGLDALVQLRPDFSYARDALQALETRLRALQKTSGDAVDTQVEALVGVALAASEPAPRRREAARRALQLLAEAHRCDRGVAVAERLLAAKLPADVLDDPNERAASARVLHLAGLLRVDEALAAGEAYLRTFPAGATRSSVDEAMRRLIERRRSEPERRAEDAAELRELAEDVDADPVERTFKPCIAAKWSTLPDEMVGRCTAFLKNAGGLKGIGDDETLRGHVRSARAYVAWGEALRGHFAEAHALADALEADDPGALDDTGLRAVRATWCRP